MAVEGLDGLNRNAGGNGEGRAFLVSAGIVFEIMAAACSSPQTTELNAGKRAPTLIKWVNIGVVGSALFVGIASALEPEHSPAIVAGGVLAGGLMYAAYLHARHAGLANGGEPTESW